MPKFDGIKVFSGSTFADRSTLGDKATDWIREHPEYMLVEAEVKQSSDHAYHCITLVLFYRTRPAADRPRSK